MVDRVVLKVFVEVAEVRRLEDEDPIADVVAHGSEDGLKVVDVREDIRPCDEVRAGQIFSIASRSALSEKKSLTVGMPADCDVGDFSARVDPVDVHAERGEFRQQGAVVGTDVDDARALGEANFAETVPASSVQCALPVWVIDDSYR